MPKSKGTTFSSLKTYVLKRFGLDGWKRLLNALTTEERAAIDNPITSQWYDFELVCKVEHLLVELLGNNNLEVAMDFGRFGAEQDLNNIERFFLRMANPAYAIEKAGQYWRRFHDWGEWVFERQGKGAAKATLKDCPHPTKEFCAELSGYLQRLFQMVGAKEVVVEHIFCRARNDRECVWIGRWKT